MSKKASKARKPNESVVLQAVQQNQPNLLMQKGRTCKKNKKKVVNSDLNLIRSDGKKRKFFYRDSEMRRNLNNRQQKFMDKALKVRRMAEAKLARL